MLRFHTRNPRLRILGSIRPQFAVRRDRLIQRNVLRGSANYPVSMGRNTETSAITGNVTPWIEVGKGPYGPGF
jgi:hypothetical protein